MLKHRVILQNTICDDKAVSDAIHKELGKVDVISYKTEFDMTVIINSSNGRLPLPHAATGLPQRFISVLVKYRILT